MEAISFSEHKLTIFYLPRKRELECLYAEDLEPMLLENRRDLIQVTGRVVMDDDDHPKKITEVEQIRELDLSPFSLLEVRGDVVHLRPRKPLALIPDVDESEQLITLEHEPWGFERFRCNPLGAFR